VFFVLFILTGKLNNKSDVTYKNVWEVMNSSFRIHGNTCFFNFEFTNGLNPAPNNTIYINDAPLPKQLNRFPCLYVNPDNEYNYHNGIATINTDGELSVYISNGILIGFKAIVVICGSYEII
jgi:hypothetical protein